MKRAFYLFLIFISGSLCLQSQNKLSDRQKKAEEYLNRILELKRISGMVLVAEDSTILLNRGFGMADYNNDLPFTGGTKFRLAGLSEQLTAYIAFRVLKENGILPDEPVKNYLGEISFPEAGAISFHHLLTHTSGLPDYPDIPGLPGEQFFSKEEMMKFFTDIYHEKEPGESYGYSKLNYNLLGLLLENISGKSFEQLLATYITTPLNMENTCLDSSSRLIKNKAKGFNHTIADGWINAPYFDPASAFAAQGILSSAEDILKWIRFTEKELITSPEFLKMVKSQSGQPAGGFDLTFNEAGKIVSIRGTGTHSSGFNAGYLTDLENKLRVIVLCNVRNPVADMTAEVVRNIFLYRDYELPPARKKVAVAPEILEEYSGEYSLQDQLTLKVNFLAGKLYVDDGMHPKFEILPQSDNQFFLEQTDAELKFIRNENGKVKSVVLRDDGFDRLQLPKIK